VPHSSRQFAPGGLHAKHVWRQKQLDASKNSPIWFVSDSIGVGESEMIPCEVSQDFSMSMIA
jgi:hypothetical protein